MGDLAVDTAVCRIDDGPYRATLSREWEIWGPMGGYVAACALRAAGAECGQQVPATFACHYLDVAQWGTLDLAVVPRRRARTANSYRVEATQGGRPVLDALVWSAAVGDGLEHDETTPPDVPPPDELRSMSELAPSDLWPPFPFWNNVEAKPIDFEPRWPPDGPKDARWQQWLRFTPTATFDDLWTDAARSVIAIDLASWPCIQSRHAWQRPPFIAPTLNLDVAFHRSAVGSEWLLCDAAAPLSTGGLFAWAARVWSVDGRLNASGGGQCKYRRTADPARG